MKRIPNIAVMKHGFVLLRGSEQASAFDIRTPDTFTLTKDEPVTIKLGIRSEVDECQLALVAPRSGLGTRGVRMCNTVGYIDTDYRGEWMATLVLEQWAGDDKIKFERGDRILQVAFVDVSDEVAYIPEDELSETERGEGGYGHTGVK